MAREALLSVKHVFLEKPIAIELHEADDLIAIARKQASSSRSVIRSVQCEYAYVKKAIEDGTIGTRQRAREPPHHPVWGKRSRPHEALAPPPWSNPRPRFRAVVPRAREADSRLFAVNYAHCANRPSRTFPTTSGSW